MEVVIPEKEERRGLLASKFEHAQRQREDVLRHCGN